ncbi:MAG TPA: hypothetical protein VGM56_10170 [Byssovorax sp.]
MSIDADSDDPPLIDPYYAAPPPRESAPATSAIPKGDDAARAAQLGVASAFTWVLGPVGAIASVVFGLSARRRVAPGGPGRAAATAGAVLGVFALLAWSGLGALAAQRLRHRSTELREVAAQAPPDDDANEDDDLDPRPAARAPTPPSRRSNPGGLAAPSPRAAPGTYKATSPDETTVGRVGALTVVDLGVKTSELKDALALERAHAAKKGETVLLMTTAGGCDPCRGVDASLADPQLQAALAKVRVVRVDVDVFGEDLAALKVPTKEIPGFFVLSPDLKPRDGINGGEWDEDIPRNIAPVLGAFVKGDLGHRRRPWTPIAGTGMRL